MANRISTASVQLVLDGAGVGFLNSFEGGRPVAAVVTEKADSSLIPKKHLGGISYRPLVMECGPAISPVLFDWINASWTGTPQRKDGSIVTANARLTAVKQLDFFKAFITETTIPALDASSKEALHLTVTLAPELARNSQPSGTVIGQAVKQKLWVASNFRVAIDGLDCTRVMRVDALTVRQATGDLIGIHRDIGQPGPVDFPNLTVTLAEGSSETWFAWFEDFVVKGNNGQPKEKNGSIALLSPDMKDEMLRIDLFGLGIFALDPEKTDQSSDKISAVTAQMYCERMELHLSDKAPKPEIVR